MKSYGVTSLIDACGDISRNGGEVTWHFAFFVVFISKMVAKSHVASILMRSTSQHGIKPHGSFLLKVGSATW